MPFDTQGRYVSEPPVPEAPISPASQPSPFNTLLNSIFPSITSPSQAMELALPWLVGLGALGTGFMAGRNPTGPQPSEFLKPLETLSTLKQHEAQATHFKAQERRLEEQTRQGQTAQDLAYQKYLLDLDKAKREQALLSSPLIKRRFQLEGGQAGTPAPPSGLPPTGEGLPPPAPSLAPSAVGTPSEGAGGVPSYDPSVSLNIGGVGMSFPGDTPKDLGARFLAPYFANPKRPGDIGQDFISYNQRLRATGLPEAIIDAPQWDAYIKSLEINRPDFLQESIIEKKALEFDQSGASEMAAQELARRRAQRQPTQPPRPLVGVPPPVTAPLPSSGAPTTEQALPSPPPAPQGSPFEEQSTISRRRAELKSQAEARGRRQEEQAPTELRQKLREYDNSYQLTAAIIDLQPYVQSTYGDTWSVGLSVQKAIARSTGIADPKLQTYTTLLGKLFQLDKKTYGGVTVPPYERRDIVAYMPDATENTTNAYRKIRLLHAELEGYLMRDLAQIKKAYPLEDTASYFFNQIRARKQAGQTILAPELGQEGGAEDKRYFEWDPVQRKPIPVPQ